VPATAALPAEVVVPAEVLPLVATGDPAVVLIPPPATVAPPEPPPEMGVSPSVDAEEHAPNAKSVRTEIEPMRDRFI
jgi:hypothetical protein